MVVLLYLISLVFLLPFSEAFSIFPRSPKGGHGGGGRGHSSGSISSSSSHSSSHSSANTGRGGSGDTGHSAIHYSYTSRAANYFGEGGGKRTTIPRGSIFSGRQIGGGTRGQVLGTRRFGSGYPYYVNDPRTRGVYGNPFPFGFWPIYWLGYGYSDEYGRNTSVADQRPGGNLSMVKLAPVPGSDSNNASAIMGLNETYWMIGDQQTVSTVLSLLVDTIQHTYGCAVSNSTILPFNSSDPQLPFRVQNVMQWYRSSSYAFVYTGYNNTYATAPLNETTSLNESTPLPAAQLSSTFVHCINTTIIASVAILDTNLSAEQIAGIVIGSVAGAVLIGLAAWYLVKMVKKRKNKEGKYVKLEEFEAERAGSERAAAEHTPSHK